MREVVRKDNQVIFLVDKITDDGGEDSTMGFMEREIVRIVSETEGLSARDLEPMVICEQEGLAIKFGVRMPAEEIDATVNKEVGFFDPEGIDINDAKALAGKE